MIEIVHGPPNRQSCFGFRVLTLVLVFAFNNDNR